MNQFPGERTDTNVGAGVYRSQKCFGMDACIGDWQAHIAQSVEHFLGKEEVTGSNPVMGSSVMSRRD